jgi:hypothetical protein
MRFFDYTELCLASVALRCQDGKTLLHCTLRRLASCHGTVVRGAFLRLVRSCVLHSLASVRATIALQVRLDWRRASRTIGGDLAFQCLFSNEIKRPSNLSNYYDDVCTWPRQVDNEGTWQQKVQRLKGPAPERRDSVDRTSRTGLGIDSQVLAVVGVSFSSFHRQTCADFRTSWRREAKCNTSDAVRRSNVGWSGIYCLLTDIHSRDVRRCRREYPPDPDRRALRHGS